MPANHESHESLVITLAKNLIRRPSVTPNDAGCQTIIADHLSKLGFAIETIHHHPVYNLWATNRSHNLNSPLFLFAGHTDVVTPGEIKQWHHHPFEPEIRDGYLYGRGCADMKGSLAAMIVATQQFIQQYPDYRGNIGFVITSGEEGDDFLHGTPKIMEYLAKKNIQAKWCVVGEPSSHQQLGDVVRIGRRRSLTGHVMIKGEQGHVAYPDLANNPIHHASEAITYLTKQTWDNGNHHFPATSLQITNIHAGNGAGNIIPSELHLQFNFRYSTETNDQLLKQQVETLLDQYQLHYEIQWIHNGAPFLTPLAELTETVTEAIQHITQLQTEYSTAGGTSDGRFIAPYGIEVVELGPVNKTIHQINECVKCDDLIKLSDIYRLILERLLL